MTVRASEESGSVIIRKEELTQANRSDFRDTSFHKSSVSVIVALVEASPARNNRAAEEQPGVSTDTDPTVLLHRPMEGGLFTELIIMGLST